MRFGDRLRFTIDVPDHDHERLVARLSPQTLVENSARRPPDHTPFFEGQADVRGHQRPRDYTLTELEVRLDPRRFVHIHRATIVTAAFVQELYPGVDGVIVRLKDDKATELSVARDRVREIRSGSEFESARSGRWPGEPPTRHG